MIFVKNYGEYFNEIKSTIDLYHTALLSIKSSEHFRKTIAYILLIGNILNSGSRSGGALGFEISLLEKVFFYISMQNISEQFFYLKS